MTIMRGPMIIMAMAAINVPFIVDDPSRWWNWCAAVFCFGVGIVVAIGLLADESKGG
jgi:uncharacterized membrane protein